MATSIKEEDKPSIVGRKDKVMIGSLPNDFLRITNTSLEQQISADHETAYALQHQYLNYNNFANSDIIGRLIITVAEAKLVKNYGVTRMDPYVRLRLGNQIYETKTCYNGAKNPKWNRIFQCFLPKGVVSIHIEIFDECAFSADEKIAWAIFPIPNTVFAGETIENWIPLNGKQGDGKEGTICLFLSFSNLPPGSSIIRYELPYSANQLEGHDNVVYGSPLVINQSTVPQVQSCQVPAQIQVIAQPQLQPQPQPQSQLNPQPVVISNDDVKDLQEMFPNIDVEVIKTILENQRGNKVRAINNLIQMAD